MNIKTLKIKKNKRKIIKINYIVKMIICQIKRLDIIKLCLQVNLS